MLNTSPSNAATALIIANPDTVPKLLESTLIGRGHQVSWLEEPSSIVSQLDGQLLQLVFVDPEYISDKQADFYKLYSQHPASEYSSLIAINKAIDNISLSTLYELGVHDVIDLSISEVELAKRITNNITAQRNKVQVNQLVYHDALTGLPNRLLLIDRVENAIARAERHNKMAALLFLNLDGLKLVNNSLGHEVGDNLLAEVAMRIVEQVGSLDTVARLGGDEFIVLLDSIESPDAAAVMAQNINDALKPLFHIGEHDLRMTVSIGMSLSPEDGPSIGRLLKRAETAMYKAKEAGCNLYRFYQSDMAEKISERLQLSNELYRALDEDEFVVYYQPQVEVATGLIVGMEALVRWHKNGQIIPPANFLEIAEENGLIVDISEKVLEKVCKQISVWKSMGIQVPHVAVNLSTKNFRDSGLVDKVKSLLQSHHLDGRDIMLEITETTAMDEPHKVIAMLCELKALGVGVAVDDFGVGHSSLSYLKRLPVDTLKIDRAFIKDLAEGTDDEKIVMAIVSLGKVFSMKVVAEGVETVEQASLLLRHQCDIIQGYLFSKPVDVDAMGKLLHVKRLAPEQLMPDLMLKQSSIVTSL